jgi:hypothetical protein
MYEPPDIPAGRTSNDEMTIEADVPSADGAGVELPGAGTVEVIVVVTGEGAVVDWGLPLQAVRAATVRNSAARTRRRNRGQHMVNLPLMSSVS